MKIRIRIKVPQNINYRNTLTKKSLKKWFINFKYRYPHRFYITLLLLVLSGLTLVLRPYILDILFGSVEDISAKTTEFYGSNHEGESIEQLIISNNSNHNVKGIYTKSPKETIQSDVGFVDLRILTLEDFFNHYGSPLADYSDEFIESVEKYDVNNWQLLPAIAIAETNGCQTGTSYEQRNCWGWGGSGDNRWEFYTFEEAIDFITRSMIRGYGNERMNAKDIQSSYCGATCIPYGWKWARGINHYIIIINDLGEKYGLLRTNEIDNFDE